MIGVKVDKNNSSPKAVQKKVNAAAKTLSSAPVAQLCDNENEDKDKTKEARQESTQNEEGTVQGKFNADIKQLKSAPAFPTIQLKTSHNAPVQRAADTGNKTGLPNNVKSGVEQLSGLSLDDVNVHYNSSKPAQLHAHAYAQGTDIHVGPGQEKHVPHEAWHVVQQKQGRVQATTQLKGQVPVNDDAGLEKEADVMGAKAVQMASVNSNLPVQQKSNGNIGVAQLGAWSWIKKQLGIGKAKEKENDEASFGISPEEVIDDNTITYINPLHQMDVDEGVEDKKEKPKNIAGEALMDGKLHKKTLWERTKGAASVGGNIVDKFASKTEKYTDKLENGANKLAGKIIKGSAHYAGEGMAGSAKYGAKGIVGSGKFIGKGIDKSMEAAGDILNVADEVAGVSPLLGGVGIGSSIAVGAGGSVGSLGLGVAGAGLSLGLGAVGVGASGVLGMAGTAFGGAVSLAGNVVGKGIELAGAASGLIPAIPAFVGEQLFQIDTFLTDKLDGVSMAQVLTLIEGINNNFDESAIKESYKKAAENQGAGNMAKSVFYSGKNNSVGDKDTHASIKEGKTDTALGMSGSILSPVGDAHEILKGNERSETMASVIGDMLVGAVATFDSIVNVYNLFKKEQSTNKYTEIKKLAYNLTVATKAGFKAATDIQKYIDGTVGPLKSVLPGLSLAVAVCDTLISVHKWRASAEIEESLAGGKEADRAKKEPLIVDWNNVSSNLIAASKDEPWGSALFIDDVRGKRTITDFLGADAGGKWSNLNKYKRVDSKYYTTIVSFANGVAPDENITEHKNTLLLLKDLVKEDGVDAIRNYCKLLTKYQLASKLHEINNKRRVHGSRETGANIISTAGAIMQLVPVDGGATASILTATGSGLKLAMTAGKWLKRFANDGKFGETLQGKDGERKSSGQKSKEYFEHALTILNTFKDLHPNNDLKEFLSHTGKKGKEDRQKLIDDKKVSESEVYNWGQEHENANQLLLAAGIDKSEFYYRVKTYNSNSIASLADFVATKLGDGR